jgi:hypothetical protein
VNQQPKLPLMTNTQERLAAIGFRVRRREAACWQLVRVDQPIASSPILASPGATADPDPICSRALLRWRDILGRDSRPAHYRISRIER